MTDPRRAVLFDLDGTLIDSIGLIIAAFKHAFDAFEGDRPSEAEIISGIGTPLVKQLARYARSDDELTMLRDRYRAYQVLNHDTMVRAFPGAVELVGDLRERGVAVGVVTSKGDEFAKRGLALSGFGDLIEQVVGIDSTVNHKPHPEPVLVALQRLAVDAAHATFVGDSPHDVAAGNAAGVRTIGVTWGPFSRDTLAAAQPTLICDTMEELGALCR
jgi:pyrophosphatase PpaX